MRLHLSPFFWFDFKNTKLISWLLVLTPILIESFPFMLLCVWTQQIILKWRWIASSRLCGPRNGESLKKIFARLLVCVSVSRCECMMCIFDMCFSLPNCFIMNNGCSSNACVLTESCWLLDFTKEKFSTRNWDGNLSKQNSKSTDWFGSGRTDQGYMVRW